MPIPDFQTLMLPFLRVIEDGQEYSLKDLINQLADEFNLTDFERNLRSENSTNYVFRNKVGWAKDTFQLPMRNSNDSSRNPKYLLKIDSGIGCG